MDGIQQLAIWALPVLFAITVHEAAHGWVASKLGDQTARLMGRVTLNPIKHIDLVGTILVPAILLFFNTGFLFGWAKPVPINPRNFKKYRRDSALVAIAGPGSNLVMALFWAIIAKLGILFATLGFPSVFFIYMGKAGIAINIMLGILNLIPIPPLDGSRVVSSLLPPRLSMQYDSIERYGLMLLLLLMFTGVLVMFLKGPYIFLTYLIYSIFGLNTGF